MNSYAPQSKRDRQSERERGGERALQLEWRQFKLVQLPQLLEKNIYIAALGMANKSHKFIMMMA